MFIIYILWLIGVAYFLYNSASYTYQQTSGDIDSNMKDVLRLQLLRDIPSILCWPYTMPVELIMQWKLGKTIEDTEEDKDV